MSKDSQNPDELTIVESTDLIFAEWQASKWISKPTSRLRDLFRRKLLWKTRNRIVVIVNDDGEQYEELGLSDSRLGKFIPWIFRNTDYLKNC
jgi:hypothetical protein